MKLLRQGWFLVHSFFANFFLIIKTNISSFISKFFSFFKTKSNSKSHKHVTFNIENDPTLNSNNNSINNIPFKLDENNNKRGRMNLMKSKSESVIIASQPRFQDSKDRNKALLSTSNSNVFKSNWLVSFFSSIQNYFKRRTEINEIRIQLKTAKSYDEFTNLAMRLDKITGKDKWKQDPKSAYYDYELISKRLKILRQLSNKKDYPALMLSLRSGLLRNLGGIGNSQLHSHCNIGTKFLIEDYITEVIKQLKTICNEDIENFSLKDKYEFFKETSHSFGKTALLLSGGATFGCYHFGIVKTLLEQRLLPRVIAGSSVGSLVAAIVGTRKDDELVEIFKEGAVRLDPFENSQKGSFSRKFKRLIQKGVLMDVNKLIQVIKDNIGYITFKEAYEKTQRVLNITVASTTRHEVPRLLNYLTAPHVLIWSAAAASCALKGLYEPVELWARDSHGNVRLYHPSGVKWSDGSVESDLPMARLSELFNINHFIVSQVNPHITLFFRGGKKSPEQLGIAHVIKYLIESEIKHRITQIAELDIFPSLMKVLQPLITQPYEGDITIVPDVPLRDYGNIISNPTEKFRQNCIKRGSVSTFPTITHIGNHCSIELVLDQCKRTVKYRIQQEKEKDKEKEREESDD